jgi:hypothetical protein
MNVYIQNKQLVQPGRKNKRLLVFHVLTIWYTLCHSIILIIFVPIKTLSVCQEVLQ